MKFLLTSAGLKNIKISNALLDLVGKAAKEISFLFVPTACNLDVGDKAWLIDNLTEFKNQGFRLIDIVDISAVPEDNWKARFMSADVICFGGGNEQYLAKVFNDLKMDSFLPSLLREKVYMGISAGSMVAGQFIGNELIKLVYPEEVYKELGEPLKLIDISFIPHLNSEYFAHVRKDNLDELKPKFENIVYSIDDETALKIDGEKIDIVGDGEYWVSK